MRETGNRVRLWWQEFLAKTEFKHKPFTHSLPHPQPNQPSGRGGTGAEPGDTMTKTTGGGSQLWQLTQNIQGPEAAASAPQGLLWKEDARPGSETQTPKARSALPPKET